MKELFWYIRNNFMILWVHICEFILVKKIEFWAVHLRIEKSLIKFLKIFLTFPF